MAREPIGFYGKFRTPGVDTSAGKRLEALAGLAGGVQDIAVGIGKRAAEERGAEEGTAAGLEAAKTGQLETKSTWGYGGASYNQAAQTAYNAGITADIKNMVGDSALEFPDDAAGFKRSVEAKFSGLTSSFDENLKTQAQFIFDQASSGEFRKVRKAEEANILRGLQADFLAGQSAMNDIATQLARDGEEDQLAELQLGIAEFTKNAIENNLVDPVALQATAEAFNDEIAAQRVLGQIDRIVFDENLPLDERDKKGKEFLQSLRSTTITDLNAKQQSVLETQVAAKVAQISTELQTARTTLTREQQEVISNLEISIDNNLASPEENMAGVNAAWSSDLITSSKRTELINSILQTADAESKKQERMQKVQAVISKDSIEPLSQEESNDYYEEYYLPGLPDDPEKRSAVQAQYIRDTLTVPSQIKLEIEQNLMSGDPERIQSASETIYRLRDIKGMGQKFQNPEAIAFARQVAFLSTYNSPEEAIETAKRNTDPNDQARINRAKETIKNKKFADDYEDDILTEYGGVIRDLPADTVNAAMLIDHYGRLVETNYIAGMTKEDAKQDALRDLKTQWSNREFGLMAFAPEDYYSVDGSVQYIRDDLYNEIAGPYGLVGIEFNKNDIFLRSDDDTARTALSGKPDYLVQVRDSNGVLHNISIGGKNRYTPDADAQTVKVLKSKKGKFSASPDISNAVKSNIQQIPIIGTM